jgi:LysM repeat protein
VLLGCALAAPALGSTAHVVVPGETLSGIAAANGLSTETLAAWNGLSSDYLVIEGATINVPTPEETGVSSTAVASTTSTASAGSHIVVAGESLSSIAAANGVAVADLAAVNGMAETDLLVEGTTLSIPAASTTTATTSGLGSVYSPYGTLYLDAAAADTWNAMRDASLSQYGVDIYPGGDLSAYRTSDQQAALYQQYLDGTGAPANPPGYSSHELGLSVDVPTEEMASVVNEIGWQYGWGRYEAPDEWWHMTYGG